MAERMRVADAVEPTPGVSLVIQHEVLGGPHGPVAYVDYVRDGRLDSCRLGRDESADVTITNTWQDELGVMRGLIDPYDILMQGRVVVKGDQAALLGVIPILQRPLTARMAQDMSELTSE